MSKNNQDNNQYYSGGLAEFVPHPTPITYSFFSYWFMGSTSLGKAMKLLGMPYEPLELPILEMKHDDVFVNVISEEKTLYAKTIFSYAKQKNDHDTPVLQLQYGKMLKPTSWITTAIITKKQSEWIAFPDKTLTFANDLMSTLKPTSDQSIKELDTHLMEDIWPVVIAIGLLSEFYHHLLIKKYRNNPQLTELQTYISNQVSQRDWFFLSLVDQIKVKQKQMTFAQYMEKYGIRSDVDYELANPRWIEMQDEIKKRIEKMEIPTPKQAAFTFDNQKNALLAKAHIELLLLRSEAKKYALQSLYALRRQIIDHAQTSKIAYLERSAILSGTFISHKSVITKEIANTIKKSLLTGKGMAVSPGTVQGNIFHIQNNSDEIPPESIGIFPNASPEFAQIYPRCKGMIFLKGGQTSHGAIVAREFGIPAIIDSNAQQLENGAICRIEGTNGTWEINQLHS